MRFLAHACAAALALSVTCAHATGPTGLLNDTGQTKCYDASNAEAACATVAADTGSNPRQDARFGRDAKTGLTKTGGGEAGFDFSCVLWDGSVDNSASCATTLAATANTTATASGTPGTDWACTKDNHTNLIWSLQTVSAINWTNATATGAGSPIDTHNTASRCGFADGWRVPTLRELLSIVHFGASIPAIDISYFPSTAFDHYWSSDEYALSPAVAWYVYFHSGTADTAYKTNAMRVRLVRSGQ